jgi:hypothetical protein
MQKVRLDFCDMWEGFSKEDNWFTNTLRQWFDIEISEEPDFLIFGQPGKQHRRYRCVKIYFGVESFDPNWRICDFALTCNYNDDPRHYRLPLYVLYTTAGKLMEARRNAPEAIPPKFCSFVVSNGGKKKTQRRVDFFHALSRYKKVDSGGRYLNNVGGPIPGGSRGKTKFLSQYKFNIAFENESKPGYTTEKIVEAFLSGTVPIYWGNPLIAREFNPGSFVNAHNFAEEEDLVRRVIELDNDDLAYAQLAGQSPLMKIQQSLFFDQSAFQSFWQQVFSSELRPAKPLGWPSLFATAKAMIMSKKFAAESK